MPTYDFLNTETNEVEEHLMSISQKEQYLKDNPHMKQHYTKVAGIVRSSGTTNVDNHGFKEVLQKVGEAHPFGSVADEHTRKTAKEHKTREIVKKHAKKQADQKTRAKRKN
tara:strand:- start:699 stop:1031 length:333 start_codon:yes stop_codon:yes gene_type:complete